MHSKIDVSKKSKRLIIWNGWSIIEVNIRSRLLKKTECLLMKKTECLPKLPFCFDSSIHDFCAHPIDIMFMQWKIENALELEYSCSKGYNSSYICNQTIYF